jgi:hypothetical protein
VAVPIGFNAAFDLGQLPVGQQLGPAAQIKGRPRLARGQLKRQHRHAFTVWDLTLGVNGLSRPKPNSALVADLDVHFIVTCRECFMPLAAVVPTPRPASMKLATLDAGIRHAALVVIS